MSGAGAAVSRRVGLGLVGGILAAAAALGLARRAADDRAAGEAREALRGGLEAFRAGEYARAAAVFEVAARGRPRAVDAPILWGMALARLGRPAEAVAAFSLAAHRAPERATVYLYRGEALAALGKWESAARDFERAGRLAGGDRRIAAAARLQLARLRPGGEGG